MQRFKKDTAFILRELRAFFKKYARNCDVAIANDLLESLGRRLDTELSDQVVGIMRSVNIQPDGHTYEILMHMHFTTRNFTEVKRLGQEMETNKVPVTTRTSIIVIKTALKMNDFEEAARYFGDLKAMWTHNEATPSTAPRHIISQVIELACKDHQLAEFLPLLDGVPLSDEVAATMLTECARQKDADLTLKVERLIRARGVPFPSALYGPLVKGLSAQPTRVQELFNEAISKGTELSPEFALALLGFCSQTNNLVLASKLFKHMKPKQTQVLVAFARFFADGGHFESACELYEQHLRHLRVPTGEAKQPAPKVGQALLLDSRLERSLMHAALRCGRHELVKDFVESSPSDIAKHLLLMRNFAASNDLEGAKNVFRSLQKSGLELNGVVYNTVLEACVECQDLKAAEAWMEETKKAGFADVVSYNTLIKAHLLGGNFGKARMLIAQMKEEGFQPNHVTFNELVNGMISKGSQAQRAEVWEVIREMKELGVHPNQVTCSILLKKLNSYSSQDDIKETMALINEMQEPIDEVLLSSVVEACVRIGQLDLLASKLKQFQGSDAVAISGSHTFGSLIKAYGHARDIDGVWRCWKAMRSRHIRPTSITLGCMVEAVVNNGDTEGAYELINEMHQDEQCKTTLNSVIYCSVLKGFTREKKLNRVWSVYKEMLERGIDLSIVTYNTVIDACARCCRMDRLTELLDDMNRHGVQRNLITYSTMLKGYCQMGDIQKAFEIIEQMKKDINKKPDEIMYNSLLDGCAQANLVDQGLSLVDQMEKEGVPPSNFTLSLLVKLMNRTRKLDRAFTLVHDISKRHGFLPNVHVYTNLVQACIAHRQSARALSTFEEMLSKGVRPETRAYAVLIRMSLSSGHVDQAVGLLRAALGLPGVPSFISGMEAVAVCNNLDRGLVGEVITAVTNTDRSQELAVPLLSDIRRHASWVRVDAAVQRKVMSAGVANEAGQQKAAPAAPLGGSKPAAARSGAAGHAPRPPRAVGGVAAGGRSDVAGRRRAPATGSLRERAH
mmetsp:Transcript_9414/g.29064  ORF Transcript_9414/g.29064 Transcript_9414/m.29064 type:complete len:1016 (-) Transcript_9414:212-3259(-)